VNDLGHRPVVVVGGGLVGAALAWGIARTGTPPLVLDEFDRSRRATRTNFALVWVQGKGVGAPAYARWTRRSAELWPGLAEDLRATTGVDVALAQPGGFVFFLGERERAREIADLEAIARETGGAAAPFEILDAAETRARVPAIGPEVIGSAYSPADGHVDSLRLAGALHAAVLARGGDYRAEHPVERIEPGPAGIRLSGPWGRVSADRVILAAGTAVTGLAAPLGLSVPMRRSKGQVLVTEKCRPFLAHPASGIRQTASGGVLIGDSDDDRDDADATDERIAAALAARAIRTFPLLGSLRVIRSWAGFRIKPLDGLPVYDRAARLPGVWVAACHSGVTLAAIHAFDLAGRILADRPGDDLLPFSSRRFPCSDA
jgi:glycine/D-amino acid oxidase-like deaminating enzyme